MALWEARCDMTESSRVEYSEAARRLNKANQQLTDLQYNTEKNTIEIIAVLRKKDLQNEERVFLMHLIFKAAGHVTNVNYI